MKKCFIVLLFALSIFNGSANVKISAEGKDFIKKTEKCMLTAYWDSNGYSIGYGHHSKKIVKGQQITIEQANQFFDSDIKIAEQAVDRLIKALPYKYEFSQGFIDGFVSFVYNAGEGGAKNSEFYHRLCKCRVKKGVMNKQDLDYTIAGLKKSKISCKTHVQRRYKEHKMMLN